MAPFSTPQHEYWKEKKTKKANCWAVSTKRKRRWRKRTVEQWVQMSHCLTSMVQDSCGSTTILYIPARCTSTTILYIPSQCTSTTILYIPSQCTLCVLYLYTVYIMCVIRFEPQGRRFTNFHYYYTVQDMSRDQAHRLAGKRHKIKRLASRQIWNAEGFEALPAESAHKAISARNSNTSTKTKTWVAYGNSPGMRVNARYTQKKGTPPPPSPPPSVYWALWASFCFRLALPAGKRPRTLDHWSIALVPVL